MHLCKLCLSEKSDHLFGRDIRTKSGLKSRCKVCANRSAEISKNKRYHSDSSYRERVRSEHRIARSLDGERQRANSRQWVQANKPYCAAKAAERRAKKLQATPKWLNTSLEAELIQIYKMRPPGMVVDHIIPLQGRHVCGLHVPWNLQYLTQNENLKKGNKVLRDDSQG